MQCGPQCLGGQSLSHVLAHLVYILIYLAMHVHMLGNSMRFAEGHC